MRKKTLVIIGLVTLGVCGRLFPHPPNATPINAITFASSKYVGRFAAFAVPIAAMLISDAVIGWYDLRILASVYLSFGLVALISLWRPGSRGYFATTLLIFSSSVLFFLTTNFAVWLTSAWYEKNVSGLLYCYLLGLPFARNMFFADMLFSGALLGFAKAFERNHSFTGISWKTCSSPSSAKA